MNTVEVIGNATLYLGDCREILPTLPKVNAVVTDPPYGIGIGGAASIGGAGSIYKATEYGKHKWDDIGLTNEEFEAIKAIGEEWIIWGANHLADIVGKFPGALVWDKKCRNGWNDTFSDGEIAACSFLTRVKIFRRLWMGALRQGKESRVHPTQKPIELMIWCCELLPHAAVILDPYMGSGTTGVAALMLGRKFIGIEQDEKYFYIACNRIREASNQLVMFSGENKCLSSGL